MQYLNPIHAMRHFCGHKTLIRSEDLHLLQKKIPQDNVFLESKFPHRSKIPNSFDKIALENCIFISKFLKRFL